MTVPQSFPRRVLLAATGVSPQIVTETLYGLAIHTDRPFVPTEIHLVSTRLGIDQASRTLLAPETGQYYQLLSDYSMDGTGIRFGQETLHEIKDSDGRVLEDINDDDANRAAADFILDLVRSFALDERCAIHASMAGGRKTMGYFVGYALSLFGRSQDRLSHVLVSQPFESHREFYYPSRDECPIHVQQNGKEVAYDCRTAQVDLAWIPFVRLRAAQHEPLLDEEGKTLRAFGLRDGMLPSYFNSKNSALNRTLKDKLGTLAALPYLVLQPDEGAGYALSLPPERIHYAALDVPRQDAKGRTRGATT